MPALFAGNSWGQVELNRSTGIVDAHMESQAPAFTAADAVTPIPQLENGMFLCVIPDTVGVSPMGRIACYPSAAPATAVPYMVYSERKQYDERESYSDFVDVAADKVDGILYPRLISMHPDSDVWTTNTINAAAGSLNVGTILYIGDDGYLATAKGTNTTYQFVVTKVYTMPDGKPGVKLMAQAMAA